MGNNTANITAKYEKILCCFKSEQIWQAVPAKLGYSHIEKKYQTFNI